MPGSGVGCRREPGLGGARCERDGWRRRRAPGLPGEHRSRPLRQPQRGDLGGRHPLRRAPRPPRGPRRAAGAETGYAAASGGGPENGDSGNRPGNPRMDRHSGRAPHRALPDQRCGGRQPARRDSPGNPQRLAARRRAAALRRRRQGNLRGQRQGPLSQPSLLEPGHRGRYPDRRTGAAGQPATGRPCACRYPRYRISPTPCTRPATATASAPAAAARWMRSARPRAARGPTTTPPQRWRRWSSPARRTAAATSAPAPC